MFETAKTRQLRSAMLAAGCQQDQVKRLTKDLELIQKKEPQVQSQYQKAYEALTELENDLSLLWDKLCSPEEADLQIFCRELGKKMKDRKGKVTHEFVISPEDKEFHLTYQSLLGLLEAYKGKEERLILQSETENLLDMARENLKHKRPDLTMLTYFYLGHGDGELTEIPPEEHHVKIREIYEQGFYLEMRECLLQTIAYTRQTQTRLTGDRSRSAGRELAALSYFTDSRWINMPEDKMVELILED